MRSLRSLSNWFFVLAVLALCAGVLGFFAPDLWLARQSLQLLYDAQRLRAQVGKTLPALIQNDPTGATQAAELRDRLHVFASSLSAWAAMEPRAQFLPSVISHILRQRQGYLSQFIEPLLADPQQTQQLASAIDVATTHLLTGHRRIIVLLQNSDELRATGGFMGSYVLCELQDGVIQELTLQDIYIPTGQFTGTIAAPPGVAEYLSSGKGWRLPDTNWNPDFPTAAPQILQFFALGKVNDIDNVIAINLPVIEKLLTVTGPIYLPDVQQTVTAENLSNLARADRQAFFPGSYQKQQFLRALFTQLKLQLPTLNPDQLSQLQQLLIQAAQQKDLQLYSRDTTIQQLLTDTQLTGAVTTQGTARYLFLVESNVGINKANRLVTRQVSLDLNEYSTTIQLQFANHNPVTTLKSERGDYINYQRVLLPLNTTVHNIEIAGQPISKWDEQTITTVSGERLKQLGILVTVPAQTSQTVVLTLSHPQLPLRELRLQKQSGLNAVPYHLTTPTGSSDLILEHDQLIQLP